MWPSGAIGIVTGTTDAARRLPDHVPTFRIFYFRDSVLDHAEQFDAPSVRDAVRTTAGKPRFLRVEIWSDGGRVGIIGPGRG